MKKCIYLITSIIRPYLKNVFQLFFITYLTLVCFLAKAQLKVGDFLPKDRLEELKQVTSEDFPDAPGDPKLYILDFWNIRCGACIAIFPKMEGLQYQFRRDIKIVALNPWEDDEELAEFWEQQHTLRNRFWSDKQAEDPSWKGRPMTRHAPSLPASNGDESWLDLFEIPSVPRHVWVDARGQIIAMPWPHATSVSNIEHYLRGGELPRMLHNPVNNSMSGTDYSLLEQWGEEAFEFSQNGLYLREYYEGPGGHPFGQETLGVIDTVNNTIQYSFVNISIADLYKAAWRGARPETYRYGYSHGRVMAYDGDTLKYFDQGILDNRVIWEVSQPEIYIGPKEYGTHKNSDMPGFDDWNLRAKFCAELVLPLEQQDEASQLFMEGLNRYFPKKMGLFGRIELRKRVCLVLKKDRDYRPLTSSAHTESKEYDAEHRVERYTNLPFNHVLLDFMPYDIDHATPDALRNVRTNSRGRHYMPLHNRNLPLLDETGITGNVDIALRVVPDDLKDPEDALNWRLKGTGLHVEKQVREIEMLVISDGIKLQPIP